MSFQSFLEEVRFIMGIIGTAGLVIFLVLSVVFGLAAIGKSIGCSSYGEIAKKEVKFSVTAGCFVHHRGEWLSMVQYNNILIAKEGLMGEEE